MRERLSARHPAIAWSSVVAMNSGRWGREIHAIAGYAIEHGARRSFVWRFRQSPEL